MNIFIPRLYKHKLCAAGQDEHIQDPREHDAKHLDDDQKGALPQPDQLDGWGRRHAEGKTHIMSTVPMHAGYSALQKFKHSNATV